MDSSWERVSRFSLSVARPVSSYFPNPKNPRSFWTLRRVTTCSADALMKYSAVSSSRVRSVMVVFGAEVTSSLKPRPTCISCGRLCMENRNAVFVPRAVCRILREVAITKRSELVQYDGEDGAILTPAVRLILVAFADGEPNVLQQHFPERTHRLDVLV